METRNYVCNICEGDGRVLGIKSGVKAIICTKCGFVWKDINTFPIDYKKTWRYGTPESVNVRNMDSVFDYRLKKISDLTNCVFNKIMDFGCGNGEFLKYLRSKGYEAFGCDSGEYIPDDPYIFRGDISDVNEENFDIIVSIETFEHIQDIKPVVTELAKRIKNHGLLYIETQFTHIDSILGWGYFDLANHLAFYSPRSMKKLLDSFGIDLIYFDNKTQKKNTLWFMRKIVHMSHVIIPHNIQKSRTYNSLFGFLEKATKTIFGKKVAITPCSDWVYGVLLPSNCAFIGKKR